VGRVDPQLAIEHAGQITRERRPVDLAPRVGEATQIEARRRALVVAGSRRPQEQIGRPSRRRAIGIQIDSRARHRRR
jgi:hypothetical protein